MPHKITFAGIGCVEYRHGEAHITSERLATMANTRYQTNGAEMDRARGIIEEILRCSPDDFRGDIISPDGDYLS